MALAELPREGDYVSIYDHLVSDVVGLLEEVVVTTGNGQSWHKCHSPESEEIGEVGEPYSVEGACSQVELGLFAADQGIQLVVLNLLQLGVIHQVSHGVVLISEEVVIEIDRSLIERSVEVV